MIGGCVMNRLLFEKTGDAVYISHLDLMRIFQRAFKRADLMIWHSKGFSPRAYVSIALPLSVGMTSSCEILDFEIEDGAVELSQLAEKLNKVLPDGIRVLKAYDSSCKRKYLTYLQAKVTLEYDNGIPQGAVEEISKLFAGESLVIHKKTKRGEADIDLLPLISKLQMREVSAQEIELDVVVTAQNPALNPQLLVTAIETHLPHLAPDFSRVERVEIFDAQMQVFR